MPSTTHDYTSILPDESLESIFSFLPTLDSVTRPIGQKGSTASDVSYEDPVRICDPAFGWLRITFVCRRWRYIAIEYPFLWTQLTYNLGPRWLDEFIVRSKGALLRAADKDFLP